MVKGTLLETPNREPQEYSRNIMEYKDPGRYIPIIYLLYSGGSRLGVPSRVPAVVEECLHAQERGSKTWRLLRGRDANTIHPYEL